MTIQRIPDNKRGGSKASSFIIKKAELITNPGSVQTYHPTGQSLTEVSA